MTTRGPAWPFDKLMAGAILRSTLRKESRCPMHSFASSDFHARSDFPLTVYCHLYNAAPFSARLRTNPDDAYTYLERRVPTTTRKCRPALCAMLGTVHGPSSSLVANLARGLPPRNVTPLGARQGWARRTSCRGTPFGFLCWSTAVAFRVENLRPDNLKLPICFRTFGGTGHDYRGDDVCLNLKGAFCFRSVNNGLCFRPVLAHIDERKGLEGRLLWFATCMTLDCLRSLRHHPYSSCEGVRQSIEA